MEDKYVYNRFGMKAARVGQAVVDILSTDQPEQSVEDTLEAYGPKYAEEIEKCITDNHKKLGFPFYVFVITKKEMWAVNLLRNFFIARKTAPEGLNMMTGYPNATKTLYKVFSSDRVELVWSLPGIDDCKNIIKNPQLHDPELVKWVTDCFENKIDEHYDRNLDKNSMFIKL